MFRRAQHGLVSRNSCFSIDRIRSGEGRWHERRGIGCERLIFVLQVDVLVQLARVGLICPYHLAFAVIGDIPPPLLGRIDPTAVEPVVEASDPFCRRRHIHRRPAKWRLAHEASEVPRASLHAAPTHGSGHVGHAVARAFLDIGLPDLISVEHHLRPCGDRAGRAFARALVAGAAEVLKTEVNRLVFHHREFRGEDAGLLSRAQKRIEDDISDTADLSEPCEQHEGRLDHVAVCRGVRGRAEAEVAKVLADDSTYQASSHVGAHRLSAGDPIVARCPLHRLIPLVDHDGDRARVGHRHFRSVLPVRVPNPCWGARNAGEIGTEKMHRCFDQVGVALRVLVARRAFRRRLTALQK